LIRRKILDSVVDEVSEALSVHVAPLPIWCGDYHSIPRRLTTLIRQKILDSVVDEVSEALSVHVVPPPIWIVVVPIGVTVLLGLRNPPRS
jgi:hypothetical protein